MGEEHSNELKITRVLACDSRSPNIPRVTTEYNRGKCVLLLKEVLSVLMLCAPSNRQRPYSCHTKITILRVFFVFCLFSHERNWHKLRNVYLIRQVATIRSINYNVGALKELS